MIDLSSSNDRRLGFKYLTSSHTLYEIELVKNVAIYSEERRQG